jgi:hypothetical protein
MRHIHNLCLGMVDSQQQLDGAGSRSASGGTALDRWTFTQPPVAVFAAIFKWLDSPSGWVTLAATDHAALRNMPIIPAGSALLHPSRVFFRLAEPLAPLMMEVPRAFGAYDDLLQVCVLSK